jgi:putative transposase
MGISQQTFYRWRCKFAGVAELCRLNQLEKEDKRLGCLVAGFSLDMHMLQDVIAKKVLQPVQKRKFVEFLRVGFKASRRRACELVGVNRSTYYYESRAKGHAAPGRDLTGG